MLYNESILKPKALYKIGTKDKLCYKEIDEKKK
jgi:hypothetical protein